MIYAIIILLALAVAFVILVRRLPQAVRSVKEEAIAGAPTSTTSPATPKPLPSFKLPAINFAPLVTGFGKVAGGLKSIKLPKLPKRTPKPAAPQATTQKEDFWHEQTTKPVETPAPSPTPAPVAVSEPVVKEVAPEPITMPAEPTIKTKGRNLPQEAEDAFAIKDYKKAERLYLRLATEDPKNAKVYSRLGVIYLEQKTYEDARDALQAAIKLEPQAASRHFNLALCYIQLGSKSKAISAMEMALKHDPSNRKYRKMLDDLMSGRI